MKNTEDEILEYIPQRHPVVMIDKLVEAVDNRIICRFEVKEDTIFVDKGVLREPGIIENIAQTIAAGAGYKSKMLNKKVKLGYIAAVKNLNIYSLPIVGDILTTSVLIVNEIFNVTIIEALVQSGSSTIADCEMRIYIEDN
jgi:predicted hotdog family 3-hydroxylacyl-ACP dehydratase